MSTTTTNGKTHPTPNYGVDAPSVMRNLFFFGTLCLVLAFALPQRLHLGSILIASKPFFLWPAGFLLGEGLLFLLYVKVGTRGNFSASEADTAASNAAWLKRRKIHWFCSCWLS